MPLLQWVHFSNYIVFSCSDLHEGPHGEVGRENMKIKNISENTREAAPAASAQDPPSLAPRLDACLRNLAVISTERVLKGLTGGFFPWIHISCVTGFHEFRPLAKEGRSGGAHALLRMKWADEKKRGGDVKGLPNEISPCCKPSGLRN